MTYPRLRIRQSQTTLQWYLVLQLSRYEGDLITSGLTWKQARRLAMTLRYAANLMEYRKVQLGQ